MACRRDQIESVFILSSMRKILLDQDFNRLNAIEIVEIRKRKRISVINCLQSHEAMRNAH